MRQTKIHCDRCGKELAFVDCYGVIFKTSPCNKEGKEHLFDVCRECCIDLHRNIGDHPKAKTEGEPQDGTQNTVDAPGNRL